MTWLWITIEFMLIIGGLTALNVYLNKKTNRQKQIYSIIENSDSESISLQEITSTLQMEYIVVKNEILSMSSNMNIGKYPLLKGSHIDFGKQCLTLSDGIRNRVKQKKKYKSESKENSIVICKHCGATNKIYAGKNNECDYCGSPL